MKTTKKTFNAELLKELEAMPIGPFFWDADLQITYPISMVHYRNKFKYTQITYDFCGEVHTTVTEWYKVDMSPVQLLEAIAREIIHGYNEYLREQKEYYADGGKNSEELLNDLTQ